jgi:hypothetical protein
MIALLASARWKSFKPAWPAIEQLFLLSAGLLAIHFRWEAFLDQCRLPLRPDAAGYLEIARTGSFYSTLQSHAPWVREPLFPALLRAWLGIAPDTASSARFFSFLLGLLVPLATWAVGRRLFGPLVALLAAALVGTNQRWAFESAAVLRTDADTLALLALVAVPLFLGERRWWRAGAFAAAAAALALLRINALFLCLPVLAWEAWRRRWHPMEIALAFLLPLLLTAPHLAFNADYGGHGDPFFSSNVHARYYLNRDMIGQPGFPATYAEWVGNEYAGEHLSTLTMFSHYGPIEVARRFVVGYANLFLWRFPHGTLFHGSELALFVLLLGYVMLLRERRWAKIAAIYALFALPVAFIAASRFDERLALPTAPLVAWAAGLGVARSIEWVIARVARSLAAKHGEKNLVE